MKITFILLSLVSVMCCKSSNSRPLPVETAQAEPEVDATLASAAPGAALAATGAAALPPQDNVRVLRKVVGALSKEDPKAQHYECEVSSQNIENLQQVQQWITEVEKAPIVEAFTFRATIPSMEVYAYKDGREILLFSAYSSARYRRPTKEGDIKNDLAEELLKIANQKCPYP